MYKRTYPINERCFDELNDRSAYFLGLLYADGRCTLENKVRLWVSEKDKGILLRYRDFLQTNSRPIKNKLLDGKQYFGLDFRSWRVHNKIKEYELTLRKEKRHRLNIKLLQPEVRRHFVRGIFDGDGGFYVDKRGYMFAEITGHKPLLKDLKNILVLDNVIEKNKHIVKNGSIFRIRFGAKETLLLGQYMYNNAKDFIERKNSIYRNHVERLNELAEKKVLSLKRQSRYNKDTDLRPVQNWNKGKQEEFALRKKFKCSCSCK